MESANTGEDQEAPFFRPGKALEPETSDSTPRAEPGWKIQSPTNKLEFNMEKHNAYFFFSGPKVQVYLGNPSSMSYKQILHLKVFP